MNFGGAIFWKIRVTFLCEFFKFCVSTSNKSLCLPYLAYVLWGRHSNLNLIIKAAPIDVLKTSYSVNVLKIHMNTVKMVFSLVQS